MKMKTAIDRGYSSPVSTDQLRFRKILPHPDLSPFIRHYLTGHCPAGGHRHLWIDLLPNNCIEIVMLHGDNFIIPECTGSGIKVNSYLAGLFASTFRKRIKVITGENLFRWTVVVLTPAGFSLFFGMGARKVLNRIISFNSISPDFPGILPLLLNVAPDDQARKYFLDEFFIKKIQDNGHRIDRKLEQLEFHISRLNGFCGIPYLSDKMCVSYRTLERIFHDNTGLNAQDYFKIERFMKVFRALFDQATFDYSDLIEAGGYFDQAHLIHDFRKITGLTPRQLYNLSGTNFYPERPVTLLAGS